MYPEKARKGRRNSLKVNETNPNGRPGAWICALGLAISLMGCQPQVYNTPALPPPCRRRRRDPGRRTPPFMYQ